MHASPDVLALLALGERAGSASELDHVASCPFCSSEVEQYRHAAELGRSGVEEKLYAPSPAVWDRIVDELGLDLGRSGTPGSSAPEPGPSAAVFRLPERRPDTPAGDPAAPGAAAAESLATPVQLRVSGASPVDGRRRAGTRWLALAVAAAVGLVAGIGATSAWDRANQPSAVVIARAELEPLPGFAGSSGEARIEEDASGRRTLVVSATDSRPGDGHEEMWLLSPDAKLQQNFGPLDPSRENRVFLPPGLDLRQFPVVDVSAENDRNMKHSGVSIVRGELSL